MLSHIKANKQRQAISKNKTASFSARLSAYVLSFLIAGQPLLATAQNIVVQGTNTQVEAAANGVATINIATPSSKGVSHNTFQHYNVDSTGLILNNAKEITATQLGGYINANSNLTGNAATVIINEVVAPNRSQLNGYTEVAGQAASVVVANPYGITCNGCGFINTPRATLTTGTPNIVNGELSSLTVNGGDISVEGAGLNASNISQFDLIARSVKLNANLHAKTLNIVTGSNQVDYTNLNTTTIQPQDNSVAFALDSSALGGMYANAIKLVGTEAGVGVRTLGNVATDVGDLTLSIDGRLENTGAMTSKANATITSKAGITNSGTLYAQGNSQIDSQGDINNNGVIAAHGNLTLQGNNITSSNTAVFAAGLNSDGTLDTASTAELNLNASAAIAAQGKNIAANKQTFAAQTINLSQSQMVAKDIALTSRSGDIDVSQATLEADQSFTASASKSFITDAATLTANQLHITAHDISNNAGKLLQTGTGDMTIHATSNLDNTQGQIATNANTLNLTATTLTNANGQIAHAGSGTATLTATTLNGSHGKIQSNGKLAINATAAMLDNGNTLANQLALNTATLSNLNGTILQSGSDSGQITAATQLNNTSGTIASNGDMALTLGNLINQNGILQTASTANLTLNATGNISNTAGQLSSAQDLTLSSNTLVGDGTLVSGRDTHITLQSDYTQTAANQINVNRNLSFTTAGNLTNNGTLQAANDVALTAATLINQGDLAAGGVLSATTATLSNRSRIIGDKLTLSASSLLENVGPNALIGATNPTGTLTLLSPRIENRDDTTATNTSATTTIYGVGNVILAGSKDSFGQYTPATKVLNQSALIESGGDMQIYADTLTNTRRVLTTSNTYTSTGVTDSGQVTWTAANPNVPGGRYIEPPHGGEWNSDYLYTTYSGTYLRNSITGISPSSLIEVGGNLTPQVNTLKNYWSSIAAGGNISLTGVTLDQDSWANGNSAATTPYSQSISYSGQYWYRTYRGVLWTNNWGPDAAVVTNIAGYDSSLTSAATISGTAASISNSAANSGSTPLGMPPLTSLDVVNGATSPDITLPTSRLFAVTPNSSAHYLVETDARFTQYQNWISSDYLLNALSLDPDTTQRRLGDGFYEQRLIRNQLQTLTGRSLLAGYTDSDSQYQALMNAAASQAKTLELTPGIALTDAQLTQLTQDMIWLVEKSITLHDGSTIQVLVPQLYLSQQNHTLTPTGSLIAANNIDLKVTGTFINNGTVHADDSLTLSAKAINNRGGILQSINAMQLVAVDDIDFTSAKVKASSLLLNAGQNLLLNTASQQVNDHIQGGTRSKTRLGQPATIHVTGDANITTGKDFEQQGGKLTVGGNLNADIGNDWRLSSVEQQETTNVTHQSGHSNTQITRNLTSSVDVGGTTNITTGRDFAAEGAHLNLQGDATLSAGRNITLSAVKDRTELDSSSASGDHTEARKINDQSVIGSTLTSRGNITLSAQNDLTVEASQLRAEQDLALNAQGNTTIASVQEQDYRFQTHKSDKSFGRSKSTEIEKERYRNIESTLSAGNNLTINADITDSGIKAADTAGSVTIIGSDLKAGDNLAIYAGDTLAVAPGVDYDYEKINIKKKGLLGTGSDYTKTSQQQRQQQAKLGSGQDTQLTAQGDITLIAPQITSEGDVDITSQTGSVTLATAKDVDYEDENYTKTGGFSWSFRNEGHTDETVRHTEINAKGDITIHAAKGVVVEYKHGGTLEESIDSLSQLPEMAWMATLKDRDDINWQAVEAIHQQWLEEDSGMGGPGFTLIAIAIAIATGGAGASIVGATATGATATAAGVAQAAVLDALINQAAMSLIVNKGDIGAVFKDIVSKEGLMSLATAGVTAGITNGLFDAMDIPQGVSLADLDTAQLVKATLINATTKATLDAAIYGESFGDSLVTNIQFAAVDAAAAKITKNIGSWELKSLAEGSHEITAGDIRKVLAHAAVGCVAGTAKGQDCSAGALGAAAAEMLSPHLSSADTDKVKSELTVLLGSGLAAALTGKDLEQTINAALQVDRHNRQLHEREINWIKENAEDFARVLHCQNDISCTPTDSQIADAQQRLAKQALSQVQYGADYHNDNDAANFIKLKQGQWLEGELGRKYFEADDADKRDTTLFAKAIAGNPELLDFYQRNKLVTVTKATAELSRDDYIAIRHQVMTDGQAALVTTAGTVMFFVPGPEDVVFAYAAGTKIGQVVVQGGTAFIKPVTDKASELVSKLVEVGSESFKKLLAKVGRKGDDVAEGTPKAFPAPRQIEAQWGANTYRHGGEMTAIEHINYRHAYTSGFNNVSKFAKDTSVKDIRSYVDSALRYGNVTKNGKNGFTVEYNIGRTIGTNSSGGAASSIRVHVRDGNIQTAFPF